MKVAYIRRVVTVTAAVAMVASAVSVAAVGAAVSTTVTDGPPETIAPGETFNVSVDVENTGDAESAAASITAVLPDGIELVAVDTEGVVLGDVVAFGANGNPPTPGDTRTATFELRVAESAPGGDYELAFRGRVNASDALTDTATTSVGVLGPGNATVTVGTSTTETTPPETTTTPAATVDTDAGTDADADVDVDVDGDGDDGGGQSLPGFGPVVAVLAVTLAAYGLSRRSEPGSGSGSG
jgi:PGF-CTERM protein